MLQDALKQHAGEPIAYIALAQMYADANRGADAVTLLQDAAVKFPSDTTIPFQLGAVYDKLKRFADAVAAFEQVIARDPNNAPALNYLGYMLAERGERLDDSVAYVKKALQIEPNNGSYLDSLGWAYFKSDKLDLAEASLKQAADPPGDQLGHPGSLRGSALQAGTLRPGDRRLDARARRRRRLDRSQGHRQEDPRGQAEARKEMRRAAVALALLAASCGAPGLVRLPSGAGAPFPDFAAGARTGVRAPAGRFTR